MIFRERKLLSLFITIGVGVALVAFLSYTIFKRDKERCELLSQKEKLKQQLTSEKKKNLWLRRERDALKSDPVRIEKEARNELGYTRPEEIPYKKYKFKQEE